MVKKSYWVIFLIVIVTLASIQMNPVQAQDGTPTAATEDNQPKSVPWFIPAIIFLGILVGGTFFKQWVAKGTKKEFTGGSCCAPLIDEDRKS